MKKGLIAFAIYFGCVVIAAALNMLGLPIIPEDVEVSPVLTLVTHLPAWLYLWFSKADESSVMIALILELTTRIFVGDLTVSVFNVLWWMVLLEWICSRESRKQWRCDLRPDGKPCDFCSFQIAKENLKKDIKKEGGDVDA